MEKTRGAAKKMKEGGAFDRESVEALYKDPSVVDSYDDERFTSLKGRIRHTLDADAVVSLLKPEKPKLVVDLATGTGRFADAISRGFPGLAVIGLDNSPLMLAKAMMRTRKPGFIHASAFSLPFADSSLDALVTFLLVRHFKRDDRNLLHQEIRRVLKPRGVLVIDVANRRYHERVIADRPVYDEIYTREEFAAEMKEAGFTVEAFTGVPAQAPGMNRIISLTPTVNGKLFVAKSENRLLRNWPGRTKTSAIWVAKCRKSS